MTVLKVLPKNENFTLVPFMMVVSNHYGVNRQKDY